MSRPMSAARRCRRTGKRPARGRAVSCEADRDNSPHWAAKALTSPKKGEAMGDLVSDADIETFWRDGVVCLRDVIPGSWRDSVAEAVEEWLNSPDCLDFTAYGTDVARAA